MELEKIRIDGIPAILWGKKTDRIIIACHGSHSSKIDDCMWILAQEAISKGYQVLSFDLPQHGERVYETDFIMPDECVKELHAMYDFASSRNQKVSLFGCSMGAYFELLAFSDLPIENVWFLSPVTDMERIIHNLMAYCRITEEQFKKLVYVDNDIEPLYYPYYEYVHAHPIVKWNHRTHILRGENDTMCEYEAMKDFCDTYSAELTVQPDGEHWFHTEEELAYFRSWLNRRI